MFCPPRLRATLPVMVPAKLRALLSRLSTSVPPVPCTVPPAFATAPSVKRSATYCALPFRLSTPETPSAMKLLN